MSMLCSRWLLIGFLALGGLAPSGVKAASGTTELCDRLFVPEGYELTCTVERLSGDDSWEVSVHPLDGTFAGLSELKLMPVEDDISDPEAWLKKQVKIDVTGLEEALTSFIEDEDNPFSSEGWWQSLNGLKDVVHSFSDLPLDSCSAPRKLAGSDDWKIDCDWGISSLRQYMSVHLVEREGEYYSLKVQAMNERRYRHLEAIANSF